jgi:hypothetical protein
MLIMFKDLIWVAQHATCGNIQDAAVGLAASLPQILLPVGQNKKFDVLAFSFLAAGRKEHGCVFSCQITAVFLHLQQIFIALSL